MSSLGEGVDVSRPRDLVAESGVGDEIRVPEGADQAFERSLTDASDDDPAVRLRSDRQTPRLSIITTWWCC